MLKKLYITFTTILFSLAVVSCSGGGDNDNLGEAQARVDIEDLMWRYVRALDTLDENAYAAVFTEDGQFGSGEKGREALMEVIIGVKEGRAEREAAGEPPSQPMHHMIVNHRIEFESPDHAFYHSYWMTVFAGSGPDIPVNVAAAGRGIDELVRLDGQWLIKHRDVAPED